MALALLVSVQTATAQTTSNLCVPEGTTFGFFNGVNKTRADADFALQKLKLAYGLKDGQGQLMRYELFYNWTNGFEDFVETFSQRLTEQQVVSDRYELFSDFNAGGGTWSDAIATALSGFSDSITNYMNYVNARDVAYITSLFASPPTISNYVAQRARLDTLTLQGNKILLFAHSQGNLFANSAYNYIIPKIGASSVALVHVAPASALLNGPWSLADKDLVINGLRVAGSVPAITKTIPGYLLRSPGINGKRDFLGHGLLEIYMNPSLNTRLEINSFVATKLVGLIAPTASASLGFITVTLTWNGSGDVDLHTTEPGGSHVYYAARTGVSGFLDVDNVNANGPEHYYATCDPARLQTGTYRFSINNFARATGRTATVQIASYNDGPLLTKDLDVGPEKGAAGNDSPIFVASVLVSKNATTGKYTVIASQ
ncbi:hypothetical protein SIL82_11755 [Sphingomonas echinoides]|uniref:Uncharacterized protein n=1 Tax=Sphingomonas echinoides TaxID=59803 RepID=A0ABU4PP80_9SPHN|nr:hypothetical protein [Sphingomonas echinoides]MDX5984938.1 hypothetical protein [Sphingomonas echinoides]